MTVSRATRRWIVVAGVLATLGVGCAYYNTLYNANQKYRDAEKAQAAQRTAAGGDAAALSQRGPQAAQYEDVIAKCKKLMATYPKSHHVDDAMLLSAKALYQLGEFDECVSALDSLQMRYPKTELLDDAQFLKGKALVSAKKYDLAVPVLQNYVDHYRKHDDRAEGLYLLCISLMQMDRSNEAMTALNRLEKDHGRSDYRFKAQVDMAEILSEKELYKESLAVYVRMSDSRIPESVRFDVLMGMAKVQEQLGEYDDGLATLGKIRTIPPGADNEPQMILLRARALAGIDSTRRAINNYHTVTKRFARGIYAAEAYYRLGELYEGMDSLQTAQKNYQEVPRAYSGSPFAEDAIKRGSDIGRVLRLQQTSGDDSPEAIAMRTFSMAEIQLFQFNNAEKAIPSYEKIANDYPDSEYAPRAVYALGYIYGVVQGDSVKAREWYDVLIAKYPDSEQTQFAYAFYKGATPPPPYSELMKTATAVKPATPPVKGRPAMRPTPQPHPTPVDTTRVVPPPPVTQPPPAPVDTSAAPSDTSRGGN
jgi:TolA-binding protein